MLYPRRGFPVRRQRRLVVRPSRSGCMLEWVKRWVTSRLHRVKRLAAAGCSCAARGMPPFTSLSRPRLTPRSTSSCTRTGSAAFGDRRRHADKCSTRLAFEPSCGPVSTRINAFRVLSRTRAPRAGIRSCSVIAAGRRVQSMRGKGSSGTLREEGGL